MSDGRSGQVCNDDGDGDDVVGWRLRRHVQVSGVECWRIGSTWCLEMDMGAARRRLQQLKKGVVMARVMALSVIVAVVSYRRQ